MTAEATERYKGLGTFRIDLVDAVPADVRRELHLARANPTSKGFAMVVVTPGRFDPANYPPLPTPWGTPPILEEALWAGVLLDSGQRHTSLSGEGLLAYLGDSAGPGHYHLDWADKRAYEPANVLVEALLDGGTLTNTLSTPGDVNLSPSPLRAGTIHATTTKLSIGDQLLSTKTWLRDVSLLAGRRGWRVRPTGHVDWGTRSQLWPGPPRVVAGRLPAGDDHRWVTVRTQGNWDETVAGFTDQAVADAGPTEGGSIASPGARTTPAPSGPSYWGPIRGDALVRRTEVPMQDDETTADWSTRAAESIAEASISRVESTDLTGVVVPHTHLEAGEPIWLYDPEAGLVDEANSITYANEELHPARRWIEAVTWQVVRPMGVGVLYVDRTIGSVLRLLDLTDWVAYSPAPAVTLEVGGSAPVL